MKILIVDDHPLIVEGIATALGELDQLTKVVSARNGQSALDLCSREGPFKLVVSDAPLPDMEIAPFIQCLSELQKGLLIVVLSSLNTPEAVIGALKAGARGFISKASNTQVLLGAIKLVLSGGMYLPPEIFLSRPRPFSSSTPPAPRNLGLTDRQTEVLALLMEGKPNKLICRELNVSEGTVKTHVSAILRALNVSNRAQVSYAITQRGAAALANAGAVPAMGDLLQRPPPAQC